MQRGPTTHFTLVTGAGGLLGRYVVAALHRRGVPTLAACRPGKTRELAAALASVDAADAATVEFDFATADRLPVGVDRVIHAAAITKFADQGGEPYRTNATGFERLLSACDRSGVIELHLISTAFAAGRGSEWVAERVDADTNNVYRNAYEKSKAAAERSMVRWLSRNHGRRGTIIRPSIIVGEYDTGRTFKYDGFYLVAKAMRLLAEHVRRRGMPADQLRVRIPAHASAVQNLVPVDWVASMIARVATSPSTWGQVVHLTHPAPPTNALIRRVLESHYGLSGTSFAEGSDADDSQQRVFDGVADAVSEYFDRQPVFLRMNASRLEQEFDLPCPAWDEASLRRIVVAADADNFGRGRSPVAEPAKAVDRYFAEFLPKHAPQSEILRVVGMTISIRFDIGGCHYRCSFEQGVLTGIPARVQGDVGEADVVYRCDEATFRNVVSGASDVQSLFLEGRCRGRYGKGHQARGRAFGFQSRVSVRRHL